jgi:hypothetical protein
MCDLISLVKELLKSYSVKGLSEELCLAPGTLLRWIKLNDVPSNYEFELLLLANKEIDYSQYSSKQKDQFYTPIETASHCFEIFKQTIDALGESVDDYHFIEPSAGDGSFLNVLPVDKTTAMDVEPKNDTIMRHNYLTWKPETNGNQKFVVFGNPPFGLRGHLALKFINHSYEFADYVCFILPQLFESDGKGVPRKRVKGYNLIYSEKIDSAFYEPDNKIVNVNTIFQIWSKNHVNDEYVIHSQEQKNVKIYSLSDGGSPSTTRNKNMIGKCDVYIPSTCFGRNNMKCYDAFDELPGKKGYGIVFNENKDAFMQKIHNTDLGSVAFLSTNSAYNLRSSQIYTLFDD